MSARTIAVIGSGLAGWSLACALARVFGSLEVKIIFLDNEDADVFGAECAGEYIHNFNDMLGVSLSDLISKTNSTFSYGTRFKAWAFPSQDFILSESAGAKVEGGADAIQIFAAAKKLGLAKNIDDFSLPAIAAKLGRFGFPVKSVGSIYSNLQFGINLDLTGYTHLISSAALSIGVTHIKAHVSTSGQKDASGYLKSLRLENGQECFADVFIDCSREGDLVRNILAFPESLERNIPELPQLTFGSIDSDPEFKPCSEWLGLENGVAQIVPLKDRKAIALQSISNARAISMSELHGLSLTYSDRNISRGGNRYLKDFWIANVVAMGKAAFELPSTPWGEFKWFRNQVVRFIELFIDFDVLEGCASEYNRLSLQEYEFVSELVALTFFFGSANNKCFAEYFNCNPLVPEVQHRLKLFAEVGRHSTTSHQVISEGQLGAFFLGNNLIPAWTDVDYVKNWRGSILKYCESLYSLSQAAAYKLPIYSDFVHQYVLHNQKTKSS